MEPHPYLHETYKVCHGCLVVFIMPLVLTLTYKVCPDIQSMSRMFTFTIFCIGWIWLVGFGFNGPLRQYFSLYRAVSQREGERGERIDESKNVQTTPTRTYCKRNRPLSYCNQNCRTPRHWKFTQHHRTTRPPHHWMDGLRWMT